MGLFNRNKNKNLGKVKVILVTGSVGKTSVAHMIHHFLTSARFSSALVATTGVWFGPERVNKELVINIISPKDFSKEIKRLVKSGIEYLVLEAPANVIKSGAFNGMNFDSLVLTNVAGGELVEGFDDEYKYAEAIFSTISQVVPEGLVVLNADDDAADWVKSKSHAIPQNLYAAWCRKTDIQDFVSDLDGMRFKYEGGFFHTKLLTAIMLENLLQAIKLSTKYIGVDQIDEALNTFPGISGRLQLVNNKPYAVIIDYAYHPAIVFQVLEEVGKLVRVNSRLITIVGAAGGRGDLRKHVSVPAVKHSQLVIFTAQDPRGEEVASINTALADNAESVRGALVERFTDHQQYEATGKKNLLDKLNRVTQNGDVPMLAFDANTPSSRYDGIEYALKFARDGDIVLILGKGDDEIMDFGDAFYEWSDTKAVQDILFGEHEKKDKKSNALAVVGK